MKKTVPKPAKEPPAEKESEKVRKSTFRGATYFMFAILCFLWWSKGFDLGIWVYGFMFITWLFVAGSNYRDEVQHLAISDQTAIEAAEHQRPGRFVSKPVPASSWKKSPLA